MIDLEKKWQEWCFHQHNTVCNQNYGGNSPYSFHLECTLKQCEKFEHLLPVSIFTDEEDLGSVPTSFRTIIKCAVLGHDLLEDCRVSYNDLISNFNTFAENYKASVLLADIIYCVTDEKGRNRKERKNEKYYTELKENDFAIFVKLCDIAANTLYSKLTNNSMYNKYKKEFPKIKEKLFIKEYEELFNYIENI